MKIIKVLNIVGIVFIVSGIIFGFTQMEELNEQRKNAQYWKEAADENYDNNLIEQQYFAVDEIYKSTLTLTLGGVISSIVSGIFFMALGTIIDLLRKLVDKKEIVHKSETA